MKPALRHGVWSRSNAFFCHSAERKHYLCFLFASRCSIYPYTGNYLTHATFLVDFDVENFF